MVWADEFVNNFIESKSQSLSDNLVNYIKEANRSKLSDIGSSFNFGNQGEDAIVQPRKIQMSTS